MITIPIPINIIRNIFKYYYLAIRCFSFLIHEDALLKLLKDALPTYLIPLGFRLVGFTLENISPVLEGLFCTDFNIPITSVSASGLLFS